MGANGARRVVAPLQARFAFHACASAAAGSLDGGATLMAAKLLAIDQGTSSTRAILFDAALQIIAVEQQEFPQHYPQPGWVEHDPEDIWDSTLAVVRRVLANTGTRAA